MWGGENSKPFTTSGTGREARVSKVTGTTVPLPRARWADDMLPRLGTSALIGDPPEGAEAATGQKTGEEPLSPAEPRKPRATDDTDPLALAPHFRCDLAIWRRLGSLTRLAQFGLASVTLTLVMLSGLHTFLAKTLMPLAALRVMPHREHR